MDLGGGRSILLSYQGLLRDSDRLEAGAVS